jgi:hypothetical protein
VQSHCRGNHKSLLSLAVLQLLLSHLLLFLTNVCCAHAGS